MTYAAGNNGTATISTDKLDYPPGDTVTFTGHGWTPGEAVTLVLHEDPLSHDDRTITVMADGFGNFTDRSFAPEAHDLLVRFVVTATGGTSGARAQTTFTDANPQSFTVLPRSISVAAGSTANYTIDVTMGGNTTSCTVNGPVRFSVYEPWSFDSRGPVRRTGSDPADPNGGNITNATVTFVVRDESNTIVETPGCVPNLPVTLIGLDPKVGTAGCILQSLNSGGSAMSYSVEIIVNNYYTDGVSVPDENIITVVQLIPGSISGGGYTVNQQSNGSYKGGFGLKTNYGFATNFNKTGKGVQGKVNIIIRGANGKKYHIKSTSVDNMALLPDGHAEFYSKANITDITNPLAPINIGGGYSLAITLWDKGEPGSSDIMGITLKDGQTLLYSSYWDGVKTVEKLIDGGNLQVRQR